MAKLTVVKKNTGGTIAQNKRARHDYFIEEKFEAGLSLQGWEVKSLRAGRMTITESYILFRDNEAFLFGAQIQPLLSASTHVVPEATRTRKLLLSRREIEKLMDIETSKIQSMQLLTMHKHLLADNSEDPVEAILKLLYSSQNES